MLVALLMKLIHKKKSILIIAAGILLFFIHIGYYFPRTVDDSFIYLRYAENLAKGMGFSYNPPEKVEGFSSIPWVVIQSISFKAGIEALTFTKVTGIAFSLLLMAAIYCISLRLSGGNKIIPSLACVILSMNSHLIFWTIAGLETPLFLSLLFWTAYLLMQYVKKPEFKKAMLLICIAFLFGISRPEAPFYLFFMFGSILLVPFEKQNFVFKIKRVFLPSITTIILLTAVEIFRILYFGEIFPHVYHSKAGFDFQIRNLLPLIGSGATILDILFTLLGVAFTFILLLRVKETAILIAILLCNLLFITLVEEDWMPDLRFFLPINILLLITWITFSAFSCQKIQNKVLRVICQSGIILLIFTHGAEMMSVETRFMTKEFATHGRGKEWRRIKNKNSLKEVIKNNNPPIVRNLPIGILKGEAFFPQIKVSTYGCEAKPETVRKGNKVKVSCYFKSLNQNIPHGLYKLFVHIEGQDRLLADHYPLGGLFPTKLWTAGIVRDVFTFEIPESFHSGTYLMYFGFYNHIQRFKAFPQEATDGNNRVKGPVITITE